MSTEDLNDLRMSEEVRPLYLAVKKHIEDNVIPIQEEFYSIGATLADRWSYSERQMELLEGAKNKASDLFTAAEQNVKEDTLRKLSQLREDSYEEITQAEKEIDEAKVHSMKEMHKTAIELAAKATEKVSGINPDLDKIKNIIQSINESSNKLA